MISLERMVAQASSVAASNVYALDRGRIEQGAPADLIVFDYEQIDRQSQFSTTGCGFHVGMKFVLVNGQVVLQSGKLTKKTARTSSARARLSTRFGRPSSDINRDQAAISKL